MDVRPIRNEADYEWALEQVSPYFDTVPREGSPEADRFDVLSALIEAYESRVWPIEAGDPVDVLQVVMEMAGHSQADLGKLLGYRSRASEVLLRKRPLTLDMIRKIGREWHIPAGALVMAYRLDGRAA